MPGNQPRSPAAKLQDEPRGSSETTRQARGSGDTAAKVKAHIRKAVVSLTAKEEKSRS